MGAGEGGGSIKSTIKQELCTATTWKEMTIKLELGQQASSVDTNENVDANIFRSSPVSVTISV